MSGREAPVLAAALVAGLLQAASFWPFEAWWLQLVSLSALVALVLHGGTDAARGARAGLAFGLGWFAFGVSWVYVSMHRYGGMPAPLAVIALILFASYLALFVAIVTATLARAARTPGLQASDPMARLLVLALLFTGLWTLAELARGWLFTGFPWLAIGYAHVDGPLAAYAPWVGVQGVSAMAALCSFAIGALLRAIPAAVRGAGTHPRERGAIVLAFALVLAPSAAAPLLRSFEFTQAHGAPLAVRLVQGNVPQEMKFHPTRVLAAMLAYTEEVVRTDVALTILPETAWTVPWSRTPEDLRMRLTSHLASTGGLVAIGMPLTQGPGEAELPTLTNSVAVIDGRATIVSRYDKRHLVPFGEFVPFGFGWFVDLMEIPLGEFARGAATQAPLVVGGQRIAFDICFEDLFGEELAAQVRGGATLLANVSNIAWFGDSHALPQHLQIARMRAIELARPMLRATNTGVTAAIGADGRVIDRLPAHAAGSLDVVVQGRAGLTPYARWGNALPFVVALAFSGAGYAGMRRVVRRAPIRTSQTR